MYNTVLTTLYISILQSDMHFYLTMSIKESFPIFKKRTFTLPQCKSSFLKMCADLPWIYLALNTVYFNIRPLLPLKL